MNRYYEFIDMMKQNNLDKEAVIDVLNIYVNGNAFLERLEGFINEDGERTEYRGVIYSNEYEPDEEEYFGENKVLFYSGDDEDGCDIVNYNELYKYLCIACDFYIENHTDKEEATKGLLSRIKEKYNHM